MGGHVLELAAANAGPPAGAVELALEVHGFRVRGFVGDHLLLEVLDGALTEGRLGWCWRGRRAAPAAMAVGAPAEPRLSAALVRERGGAATLHVAGPMPPGHWAALELRLDRPGPLVPLTGANLEPWLLLPPLVPNVLSQPAVQPLAGALREVPPRGQLECPIAWPDLPALRRHVALARVLFVSPDGSVVAGASPAVPLRL
jgi:hypothetical protein